MESQLKKIALITLGVFYLVSLVFELFQSAVIGDFAILIIGGFLNFLYLLGFFGYVLNKRIWNAVVWRKLFFLLLCGTVTKFFISVLFINEEFIRIIESILETVFSFPIIYCLYKYSKTDRSIWLSAEDNMKINLINDLFIKESILFVEKTNGVRKAKVTVSKESKTYIVQIIRSTDKDEESFTKKIKNIRQLMTFIEQYSMIRVSDFEEKYA